jgi:hypothetical protein
MEVDLGLHVLQPLHQEVGLAHPSFDRAEGVFDDPPPGAHGIGRSWIPGRWR